MKNKDSVSDYSWILNEFTPKLVSVIIPTYNRSDLLKEAINSTVNQTYRPIECIVVDDGSIEDIKSVVESFQKYSDDNLSFHYIHQQNSGSQSARNKGTLASKGEYIQYLDSDDLLYSNKIAEQVYFFKQNSFCDGVFGNWNKGLPDKNEFVKAFAKDDLISQFIGECCIHTLSFLMKRSLIAKIGPWDLDIKRNQEVDFHLRGLLVGANYQYQDINCGLWRTHSGERIISTTGMNEILFFYRKWVNILINSNLLNPFRSKVIGNIIFWQTISFPNMNYLERINTLAFAFSLNNDIVYFNTRKFKLLRNLLGNRMAIFLWFFYFRNISKIQSK